MHAEDDDGQTRKFALDVPEQIETAADAEAEVEDDQIDGTRTEDDQQFVSRLRFPDHCQVARLGDDLTQPLANDRMIVGDHDLYHQWSLTSCQSIESSF